MRNSATTKVIGEETIQFRFHDRCITALQGVRHVLKSRYNLTSLGALRGEGFSFSSKGDLIVVSKEGHVRFLTERVYNVYMLKNLEVIAGGLQLSSTSEATVVEQSKTMMFQARMFSCILKRN